MPRIVFDTAITPELPPGLFDLDHGTQCLLLLSAWESYARLKPGLYVSWSADDEGTKTEMWKKEGAAPFLQEVSILQGQLQDRTDQLEQEKARFAAYTNRADTEYRALEERLSGMRSTMEQDLREKIRAELAVAVELERNRAEALQASLEQERGRYRDLDGEYVTLRQTLARDLRAQIQTELSVQLANEKMSIESLKTSLEDERVRYRDLDGRYVTMRQTMEKDLRVQIQSELSVQLEAYKQTVESLNRSLDSLRSSQEATIEKRLAGAVLEKTHALETAKLVEVSALREELSTLRERCSHSDDATAQNRKLTALIEGYVEQIRVLTTVTPKASHIIGKEGEDEVESLIQIHVLPSFLSSDLVRQTSKGHAGDFHLSLQSPQGKRMRILVEAKKYAYSVDKSEITKFKRDCDNPENHLDAGILLSLQTSISCYYQFQIEKTETGKHILYLSMQDLPVEDRGRTLLWAVRVLSAIVSYAEDPEKQAGLLEKALEFWRKMESSRSSWEEAVKHAKKGVEIAEKGLHDMAATLDDFRTVLGIESPISPEPVVKKRAAPRKKREGVVSNGGV
jgi:hypothetical protein